MHRETKEKLTKISDSIPGGCNQNTLTDWAEHIKSTARCMYCRTILCVSSVGYKTETQVSIWQPFKILYVATVAYAPETH